MALAVRTLDHSNGPALSRGMRLGVSGVSAPPLQTIGLMTAVSAADGSFSDIQGLGQEADDGTYAYFGNTNNNRFDRFSLGASGLFVFDSKVSSLSALGAAVAANLVAIDLTRNQIHLGSSSQTGNNSTWIGVWNLSSWPILTVANRVRSYGRNDTSNGSGIARNGLTLTLVGDIAYVCSSAADMRILAWNHVTGALVAEGTRTFPSVRFASDGTKLYSGAAAGIDNGLWQMNANLTQLSRLDNPLPASNRYTRRNYLNLGTGSDIADLFWQGGRLYVRTVSEGRIVAWRTADNLFEDEFLWPGGASATESYGHAPGQMFSMTPQWGKMGGYSPTDTSKSAYFMAWSGNATGNNQESFWTAWPTSIATATWVISGWSTGTNTLKSLLLIGTHLSGEKYKLRLRKNAGSWITFTGEDLKREAFFASVGTLTSGDTLTVELSLSTWDRLDFMSGLVACRDKLTPTDVSIDMLYEDTALSGVVATPFAVNSFKAKAGLTPAFKAKIGG